LTALFPRALQQFLLNAWSAFILSNIYILVFFNPDNGWLERTIRNTYDKNVTIINTSTCFRSGNTIGAGIRLQICVIATSKYIVKVFYVKVNKPFYVV